MLYLYDPRTNILSETTYAYLEELTRHKARTLASYKSNRKKILRINCYLADDLTTVEERRAWYEAEKYHDEAWKHIKGSDDKFSISNYGRIKRHYKTGKSKLLLPFAHRGNLMVKARINGKYDQYKISILVGKHFVGDPKPGEVLRHKNGVRTDNFAGNLEWISKQKLGQKTGGLAKSKPVVQLDIETGETINEFKSAREAGRQCYLSYQAVLDNCNRKTKISGGYIFRFLDEYDGELA